LGMGRQLSDIECALLPVWSRTGHLASAIGLARHHEKHVLSDFRHFALYSRRFFREMLSCLTSKPSAMTRVLWLPR
jgi:hypothetical protein